MFRDKEGRAPPQDRLPYNSPGPTVATSASQGPDKGSQLLHTCGFEVSKIDLIYIHICMYIGMYMYMYMVYGICICICICICTKPQFCERSLGSPGGCAKLEVGYHSACIQRSPTPKRQVGGVAGLGLRG